MKRNFFILSFLSITVFTAFISCDKEDLKPIEIETEITYSTVLPKDAALISGIPGWEWRKDTLDEPSDCQYEDCKALIQAIIEYYTPLVKSSCKGVKKVVECCSRGNLVYATVKIKPPPDCAYPDPVFDDNNKKQALLINQEAPNGNGVGLTDPEPKCTLPTCDGKVAQLKANYQPIVDTSCKPMTINFYCCDKGGQITKRYLALTPNPAGCFITDKEDSYKGKKKY